MPKPRIAPRLESLEGRELMACQIFEQDGVLTILGDNRPNNVEIYDVDGNFTEDGRSDIEVVCDGQLYAVSTQINTIVVNLRNGNDRLTYDLGDPALFQTFFPQRNLQVFMGGGNDQVVARINGFSFDGVPGVQGLGPGNWNLQFELGGGNDQIAVDLNADLLGLERETGVEANILAIGVAGGGGNDRINFFVDRAIRVELSTLLVILRGGAGGDIISTGSQEDIRVEEATVSFERYGEAGNDRIFGNLDFQSAGDSQIDQILDSGAGSDLVSFFVRNRTRRALARLRG